MLWNIHTTLKSYPHPNSLYYREKSEVIHFIHVFIHLLSGKKNVDFTSFFDFYVSLHIILMNNPDLQPLFHT